jgi:hypothetical protein
MVDARAELHVGCHDRVQLAELNVHQEGAPGVGWVRRAVDCANEV